jgi:hypothetical protein
MVKKEKIFLIEGESIFNLKYGKRRGNKWK